MIVAERRGGLEEAGARCRVTQGGETDKEVHRRRGALSDARGEPARLNNVTSLGAAVEESRQLRTARQLAEDRG